MGFVILTRNPTSRKLIAIIDSDDEYAVAEFKTESDAIKAAHNTTVCKAWGYKILEVERP